MQVKYKIAICVAPYLVAAGAWFGLTSQSISDWQDKTKELDEKSQEQMDLKAKLSQLAIVEKDKTNLDSQIQQLRESVPKSPDVDVLIIDLEKLCLESDMDIVKIGKPEDRAMKNLTDAESKDTEAAQNKLKSGLGKPAEAPKKEEKKPDDKKLAVDNTDTNDTGLSKEVLQISVTGSYQSMVELMKKLSSYQRVIGINQVEVSLPTASTKMTGDPAKRLNIDFILTAYYLP